MDDYLNGDLIDACVVCDVEQVKQILGTKPNLQAKEFTGETTLHFAAHGGSVEIVQLLLSAGAKIDTCNNRGENILHTAAEYGHRDLIRFLLDNHFFDVNCHGHAGKNVVVEHHELGLVFERKGITPLHKAAENGKKSAAELLLEYGADVNGQDVNGQTPLHYAALKGHIEMIDLLIAHGADINHADKYGVTPAAEALWGLPTDDIHDKKMDVERQKNAFDCLRQHGAMMGYDVLCAAAKSNAAITNSLLSELLDGNSYNSNALNQALYFASASHCYDSEKNVKLLLQHGAFPETHLNGFKYNALQIAIGACNGKVVKLLVQSGADLSVKDSHGRSLVMLAAFKKSLPIVKMLATTYHLPCDETDKDGDSPLLLAVDNYAGPKLIEYLLSQGADVNRQNKAGQTALHIACKNGNSTTVNVLLSHGADKTLTDNNGKKPADLTTNKSIMKLLGV